MSRAMEILYGDHRTFIQLLDLIEQEIETFRQAEQPDYELLEAILDYFKNYPDCLHHPAEDLVYKKLRERAPELCVKIPNVNREHDREAKRLHTFTRLVDMVLAEEEIARDAVIQAAQSFVHHMRRHLEMEESRFFPAALEHLQAEDWVEIDKRLRVDCGRAFSGGGAAQFDDLRREIMRWQAEREP